MYVYITGGRYCGTRLVPAEHSKYNFYPSSTQKSTQKAYHEN